VNRVFLTTAILVCSALIFASNIACSTATDTGFYTPKELYRLQDARTHRVSTSDTRDWHDGNGDSRKVEAGETYTVADIEGPGIIQHIWFTLSSPDVRFSRKVVLRMYWDDRPEPSVEAPFGDFFASGHGLLRKVNSLPISVGSEGRAFNSYWPMPFNKRARITLTNDTDQSMDFYAYVDYQKVSALPPDTAYFHAQYRQEYPTKLGQHYLILDAKGKGHYVGTVLSSQYRTYGWFGEGDDFFYIDGETEPSLKGTGTEDYFCEAYGFRELGRPYYGVTTYEGHNVGDRTTIFRWHIADPVHFKKSIRVTIEHRGSEFDTNGKCTSGSGERSDLNSSVAFWYQTGIAKRFTTLPPASKRVVPTTVIEMEDFIDDAKVIPADTILQRGPSTLYSGRFQLLARFKTGGGSLEIPFTVEKDLKGLGRLRLAASRECGAYKVLLDGKQFGTLDTVDLYCNPHLSYQTQSLGMIEIPTGRHVLRFEDIGKNPASRGNLLGVDAILIEQITPYAVPVASPDTN